MGWTDERVETLKRLWLDGLSASQIAKQLGGVTRNAVIGKVARLALSGRAAPSQPARIEYKAPKLARPASTAVPAARRLTRPATVAEEAPPVASASVVAVVLPLIIPPSETAEPPLVPERRGSATVLTLGTRMCKWPIGDPASNDFTFCGRRSSEGGPYCVEHARVAYQPLQAKKKTAGAMELARSLRRYV